MAQYTVRSGSFYDSDHVKRTLLTLNAQRNMSQFCDVVLKVCDTQIYAHSNILAAASPYFGSFLGTGADFPRVFSQKVPQIIEIHIDTKDGDDGYGEAVSRVVEYMYTSHITLTATLVSQIVEISKIMQMDTLLFYCGQFQNGNDSNHPCDKATCTSGLKEIANLMGGRSKILKRVDVSTSTEETIFKKLESCLEEKAILNQDMLSEDQDTAEMQKLDSLSGNKEAGESEQPGEQDIINMPVKNTTTDQSEVSLLLELSNVRPPAPMHHEKDNPSKESDSVSTQNDNENVSESEPLRPSKGPDTVSTQNDNAIQSVSPGPLRQTDDYLKNVHTLADMMSIAVGESEEHSFISHNDTQFLSSSQSKEECNKDSATFSYAKDLNLEEISDLVKFGLFKPSTSDSLNMEARDQPRGRSSRARGGRRGRGRGRGRRGRPWRHRKSVFREEQESDPEFDDFMNRLEKGDDVNLDIDENSDNPLETKKAGDDLEGSKTDNLGSPGKLWTSRRKRSRPSQLRKDYVMHSLAKRSYRRSDSNRQDVVPAHVKHKSSTGTSSLLKFVCHKCEFASSVLKEYRQHMKTHPETDPRNFVCDKAGCDFKTTKSREFTTHKHKHMTEELVCVICEHRSETQEEFQTHRKKHEGENPYFCTECDSRFRTRAQLLAHKPKHQVEKPFVCAICHAGFKWKHALKYHMVTHRATKDHLCDECGYATAHKAQLKAHMLVHTGLMYRCPHPGCTFKATRRQNLKYHMVTHTQEKPHQCEVCGQSFSLVKNMRRHMLLHTGARPFSCGVCGFSTTRYDKLKEHNQKLHNLVPLSAKQEPATQVVVTEEDLPQPEAQCPQITYVATTDGSRIITLAKATEDGSFMHETLQTVAQLAQSHNLQENTIIKQECSDSNIYPVVTTLELYEDADGVKYIAT